MSIELAIAHVGDGARALLRYRNSNRNAARMISDGFVAAMANLPVGELSDRCANASLAFEGALDGWGKSITEDNGQDHTPMTYEQEADVVRDVVIELLKHKEIYPVAMKLIADGFLAAAGDFPRDGDTYNTCGLVGLSFSMGDMLAQIAARNTKKDEERQSVRAAAWAFIKQKNDYQDAIDMVGSSLVEASILLGEETLIGGFCKSAYLCLNGFYQKLGIVNVEAEKNNALSNLMQIWDRRDDHPQAARLISDGFIEAADYVPLGSELRSALATVGNAFVDR